MNIYALGSNGSGQLGIGHLDDVSVPQTLRLPVSLQKEGIKTIAAGGNHTLVLTTSGALHATGCNTDGRCGVSVDQSELTSFVQIGWSGATVAPRINLCVATWEASTMVTHDGKVFVCGSGAKGELGLGPDLVHATPPHLVPRFPPENTTVIDLAACMGHVVAVLSNGDVWGWGNGLHGQLGEPPAVVSRPRKLEDIPFKTVRAVCGKDFTCVFGDKLEGRLSIIGLNKRDRYMVKPNTPKNIRDWTDVRATWGGVYALLSSGKLVAWGRNDHGQLPPANLPRLRAIAAGSEHVLALTEVGKTLAWGWGEHGNCAEPTDEHCDVSGRWNELEVQSRVTAIAAGCATSWIITSQSDTYK